MADYYNDIIVGVAPLSPDLHVSTRLCSGMNVEHDGVVDKLGHAFGGWNDSLPATQANDNDLPTNVELRLDVGTGPHGAVSRPRPCLFVVGTLRCGVTARIPGGKCALQRPTTLVAPLNAARTARRAVPT
ncbi:MAG TPA: hypothetical protein VNV43_03180 [Candidatus Acidoferrales bacterium]|nr:hypothetical protein [Candidatus Acidoferrales bacterium]